MDESEYAVRAITQEHTRPRSPAVKVFSFLSLHVKKSCENGSGADIPTRSRNALGRRCSNSFGAYVRHFAGCSTYLQIVICNSAQYRLRNLHSKHKRLDSPTTRAEPAGDVLEAGRRHVYSGQERFLRWYRKDSTPCIGRVTGSSTQGFMFVRVRCRVEADALLISPVASQRRSCLIV